MRAMRLDRPGPAETMPLRAAAQDEPRPAAGEIILQVEACGVCRTDLHILEGEVSSRLPIVPGHQAAGRVIETGRGVEGFGLGEFVGVGWMASTCGICSDCRSGRENLCLQE